MLGIDVVESTVARYMVKRPKPASPTWRTFLVNHVDCLASIDFLTVPTVGHQVLFGFVVPAHPRRRVLPFAVTEHPTAEWASRQIVEASPRDTAPRRMIRDRDSIYGDICRGRVEATGIEPVFFDPSHGTDWKAAPQLRHFRTVMLRLVPTRPITPPATPIKKL
jgi:hypothetical protein